MSLFAHTFKLSILERNMKSIVLNDKELKELASYIRDYINYELDRKPNGLEIDSFMLLDAIEAYMGGAR